MAPTNHHLYKSNQADPRYDKAEMDPHYFQTPYSKPASFRFILESAFFHVQGKTGTRAWGPFQADLSPLANGT